jgi:hypothetical protein
VDDCTGVFAHADHRSVLMEVLLVVGIPAASTRDLDLAIRESRTEERGRPAFERPPSPHEAAKHYRLVGEVIMGVKLTRCRGFDHINLSRSTTPILFGERLKQCRELRLLQKKLAPCTKHGIHSKAFDLCQNERDCEPATDHHLCDATDRQTRKQILGEPLLPLSGIPGS